MNCIKSEQLKTSEIDGQIQRLNIAHGELKDALRVLFTRLQSVSSALTPQENKPLSPTKEPCYSPIGTAIQEAADAGMDMHNEVHRMIDGLMI